MRFANAVAHPIRPRIAGLALVWHLIELGVVWSSARLWTEVTTFVGFLSMTGVASACSLVVALCVIGFGSAWRWRDLGLTPRQLLAALTTGVICWATNQAVQLIDAAFAAASTPRQIDLSGAFLNAYNEEVLFRFLLLGAAAFVLVQRLPPRRAIWCAIAISSVIFVASHIPHDLVVGDIHRPLRYPSLLGYAGLLSLVYLTTGNLMTATVLHMLGNEPALVVSGPHVLTITTIVNWTACILVIVAHGWVRGREARSRRAVRERGRRGA